MLNTHLNNLNALTAKMLKKLYHQSFLPAPGPSNEQELSAAAQSTYLAHIGLRNKQSLARIFLAFCEASTATILADLLAPARIDDEREELSISGLGELANAVACELAADKLLSAEYGPLLASPPVVYTRQSARPDFLPWPGQGGHLEQNQVRIYTWIGIFPVPKSSADCSSSFDPATSLAICPQ